MDVFVVGGRRKSNRYSERSEESSLINYARSFTEPALRVETLRVAQGAGSKGSG